MILLPEQIVLSMTRISQTVEATCSPALLTMIQYQYTATIFPPEVATSPPVLLRLTWPRPFPWYLYWRKDLPSPQPTDFCVPSLDMIIQTALHKYACMPIVVASIKYFIMAAQPISLNLRWLFSDSNLASLYARQDWKHTYDEVFLLLPTPMLSFAPPLPLPPKMFQNFQYLFLLLLTFPFYPLPLPVKFLCHSKSITSNFYHFTSADLSQLLYLSQHNLNIPPLLLPHPFLHLLLPLHLKHMSPFHPLSPISLLPYRKS